MTGVHTIRVLINLKLPLPQCDECVCPYAPVCVCVKMQKREKAQKQNAIKYPNISGGKNAGQQNRQHSG